ncbi:hypothetical protein [Escherichia coli]|uniref:hypothetical protein n=2 Tax=Escherichia coli TaxID=562 RepID=UPI00207439BE|nr:hypothetical protein [Escherichia coli]
MVLFPIKEDDPRNQVNFLYEPSERPYCHHASVRVDEKERQVRCKICGAVVEPFDWMLSVAKRETRLADDVRLLRQEERERRKNIEKLIQIERNGKAGNDSNLLIVFYVQIMPDDFVMQLHRF